ncbi:lactonase family protein [Akkermansiaceae bacterium]|nr:lactonase family protein [Akkermansiaceae bacterium]
MRNLLLAALAIPLAHAQPVFIGTGADGIYLADFDAEKGSLSEPKLAVAYERPGFLALHPELPVLLAIGGKNKVASFAIGDDYALTLLGDADSGGKGPCHLAVDASGRTVAVANYGGGSVATIRLDADGKPGATVSLFKIEGSGPNKQRQNEAHAHGVYFDNANRFLFVPDLGIDKTLIYAFDPATSELRKNEPDGLKSAPGAGPRHMAFSPDEKHAYVVNELDNTVTAASFDASTGALTTIASVPTLPEDFKGQSTTAEIEVHPTGKFVYASNRGHDSIAVFQRDPQSGQLTFLQHAPCGGAIPRHFKIHPSGKWLLCGHQKDNTISVLPLNPETGLLGDPQSTVKAPAPICLLFP